MCYWWNVHLSYGTVLVAQHEASTHTLVLSRHPPTLSISPCPTADVSTATATAAAASFESAGPSLSSSSCAVITVSTVDPHRHTASSALRCKC